MKVHTVIPREMYGQLVGSDSDEDDDDDKLFVRLYKCKRCPKAFFDSMKRFDRHMRKYHSKKKKKKKKVNVVVFWKSCSFSDGSAEDNIKNEKMDCSTEEATTKNDRKLIMIKMSQKPLTIRPSCVVLERLRYFEVKVSTPRPGFREISYTGMANSSKNGDCDNISNAGSGIGSGSPSPAKYEEYRKETISAIRLRPQAPAPPSAPMKGSPPQQQQPFTSPETSSSDKSLHLRIPSVSASIFNINGLTSNVHSILDVITGQKMESVVLDAYMTRLLSSYNDEINAGIRNSYKLRPISTAKFQYLSVCFLPAYGLHKDSDEIKYTADKKYFPAYDLDEDTVLIAPLFACHHFYLAILNFYTKSVYVYDSSWGYANVTHILRVKQVEKLLFYLIPNSNDEWGIHLDFKCAQQLDDFSCGAYVIYFAENHLKGKSHRNRRKLKKEEVMQIRTDIITELLPSTRSGRQLLEALTV